MKSVLLILSFITGFFCFYFIFSRLFGKRILIAGRLAEMKAKKYYADQRDEELEKPFLDRIVMPALRWIALASSKLAPVKRSSHLERKLTMAGTPLGLQPEEFVSVYYSVMVLFALLGLAFAVLRRLPAQSVILYTAGGVLLGYAIVELWLRLRGRQRSDKISQSLPDLLDLLTVSVEAGLGFDAALSRVVEKQKGFLAQEIAMVLQEMKMGRPRREALRDLGNRAGVEEVQAFVSSVIQADQLGVSIGNVLRSQSAQNRIKRRQKVEEKAMKAPVKMLFPLVFFIFPAIFVVLLAPAIIMLIENMGR